MLAALGMSHVKVCVDDPLDGGAVATQHLLTLYKLAPPVGVTVVVTSTATALASFAAHEPQMFRDKTCRVVHVGGALVEAELTELGNGGVEPSGAMELQPDPAAQNNRLDLAAARAVYREAQRSSVPLCVLSRHLCAAAARWLAVHTHSLAPVLGPAVAGRGVLRA